LSRKVLQLPAHYSGEQKIEVVECRPPFDCAVPERAEGQGRLRGLTIDVRSILLHFAIMGTDGSYWNARRIELCGL